MDYSEAAKLRNGLIENSLKPDFGDGILLWIYSLH